MNLKEIIEKQEKPTRLDSLLKPKSQKQELLELLQKGYHLTKLQILHKCGIWNSGEAIRRLRNEGHAIKTRMEKHAITGKRFAVYYLEN